MNYKGSLNEWAQKHRIPPPCFTTRQYGENVQVFHCSVSIPGHTGMIGEAIEVGKKQSEQEAARLALSYLNSQGSECIVGISSSERPSVEPSHTTPKSATTNPQAGFDPSLHIQCKCGQFLADSSDVIFYAKLPEEVQLVIKPERIDKEFGFSVSELMHREKKFDSRNVICKHCSSVVGKVMQSGPNSACLTCFGIEKILFFGCRYTPGEKWWKRLQNGRFSDFIECRTCDNFILNEAVPKKKRSKRVVVETVFPQSLEEILDINISALLPFSTKIPREEQMAGYRKTMIRNTIAVIPTGCGKTLMAALTISHMKLLNPKKTALLLVDRVPLVYQQMDALVQETGLVACPMCGESITSKQIANINSGMFDVVVATAGCFQNFIRQEKVFVADFCIIVFDECHHATKDHVYNRILDSIEKCSAPFRPRLMGLTASPVNSGSTAQLIEAIKTMKKNFGDAELFRPDLPKSPVDITWKTTELTMEQLQRQAELISRLELLLSRLSGTTNGAYKGFDFTDLSDLYSWPALVSLFSASRQFEKEKIASEGRRCVNDLEVNFLLGPVFTDEKFIQGDSNQVKILLQSLGPFGKLGISSQLFELASLLHPEYCRVQEGNHQAAILIFVATRLIACLVKKYVVCFFPDFLPEVVVGQGGFDGMFWDRGENSQNSVLESFRNASCKLIISTSVLEEGLDVQRCDKVFRLGGRPTVIQLIQSAGRARKQGGEMVVICSEQEHRHYQQVESSRTCLEMALEHQANDNRAIPSHSLIGRLSDSDAETIRSRVSRPDSVQVTLKFFVNSVDPHLQASFLSSIASTLPMVYVDRVEVFYHDADERLGIMNFFGEKGSMLLANMSSPISCLDQLLCSTWDFRIRDQVAFVDLSYIDDNALHHDSEPFAVRNVECGYLSLGSGTFSPQESLMFDGTDIFLEPGSGVEGISLRWSSLGGKTVLRVPPLHHAIITSSSRSEDSVFLYFMMKYTPRVIAERKEGAQERIWIGLDSFNDTPRQREMSEIILDAVSKYSILRVRIEVALWSKICHAFGNLSKIGLPLLATRILDFNISEELSAIVKAPVHLRFSPQLGDISASTEFRRLEWEIAAFCTDIYWTHWSPQLVTGLLQLIRLEFSRDHSDCSAPIRTTTLLLSQLRQILQATNMFSDSMHERTALLELALRISRESIASETCVQVGRKEFDLIPENFYPVHRVLITPSRIRVLPSVPVAANRFLNECFREFYVTYAVFRDEQGQPLFDKSIAKRFSVILQQGFDLCGVHFSLLFASNSQVRQQTLVFVAGDSALVTSIRNRFIPDLSTCGSSIAKKMSRLGLFCTSAIEYGNIQAEEYIVEPDVRARDGALLTDGSGFIGQSFLSEKTNFDLMCSPSLVHVRVMGCKGTLLVVPDSSPVLSGSRILFRNSMKKCDSPHNTLAIIKTAEWNPLRLNREAITLLECFSGEGRYGGDFSIHSRVVEMQNETLNKLSSMLLDVHSAQDELKRRMMQVDRTIDTAFFSTLEDCKYNILNDRFWLSLLKHIYTVETRSLRIKTHIPVEDGCLLIGAPDPFGILKDDEIFFQIPLECVAENSSRRRGNITYCFENQPLVVLTGQMIIYRNPCLHPGDIRIVTAVDKPELHPWRSIVLMPCNIVCSGSLSAQCSGGDLDGDQFSIIWDERLVPKKVRESQPENYGAIQDHAKNSNSSEPTTEAEYFVRTMTNASLGRIAHLHLAIADAKKDGAKDPLCIDLARQQSLAVDYPKTGISPTIPKEAKQLIHEQGYPDFMEKGDGNARLSEKLLGMLYRRCISIVHDSGLLTPLKVADISIDKSVSIAGDLEAEAEAIYRLYDAGMKQLITRFSLTSEVELILALPNLRRANENEEEFRIGSEGKSLEDSLRATWKSMRTLYRRFFYQNIPPNSDNLRSAKALAWLRTANKESRFPSFAWIVADEVAEALTSMVHDLVDVADTIGKDALKHWDDKSRTAIQAVKAKRIVYEKVVSEILSSAHVKNMNIECRCGLYGSVATLMCDIDSDVDILVDSTNWNLGGDRFLMEVIIPAIDGIANARSSLVSGRAIPLVKLQVSDDDQLPSSVDICPNVGGYFKAQLIRAIYKANALALPLFGCLTEWCRSCGLTRNKYLELQKKEAPLNSGQVQALILSFLTNRGRGILGNIPVDLTGSDDDSLLFDIGAKCSPVSLGEALIEFFTFYSSLKAEKFSFRWPIPILECHEVEAGTMEELSQHCLRSLHCLAVTRSFSALLDSCISRNNNSTSFEYSLRRSLSAKIANALTFHASRLQTHSGARVRIVPSPIESGCFVVLGEGTYGQILKLRKELLQLIFYGLASRFGAIIGKSNLYFLAGANLLCAKRSALDSMFSLVPYLDKERTHPGHRLQETSVLQLESEECESWEKDFEFAWTKKVMDQISLLPKEAVESLMCYCHFGTFYLVGGKGCFDRRRGVISLDELGMAMARNRNRKIDNLNREFDPFSLPPNSKIDARDTQQNIETKKIPSGNSDSRHSKQDRDGLSHALESNSIASGFWNSVTNFDSTLERIRRVLSVLGYSEISLDNFRHEENPWREENSVSGSNFDLKGMFSHVRGTTLQLPKGDFWKVEVLPSASYAAWVNCEAKEHGRVCVRERPLAVVHATLISPERNENGLESKEAAFSRHDVRLKIVASNIYGSDSEFHRAVCPDGNPPIQLDCDGHPEPASGVIEKEKVLYARIARRHVYFANPALMATSVAGGAAPPSVPLSPKAYVVVSEGTQYHFIEHERQMHHFVDISFDVDTSLVIRWSRMELSESQLCEWAGLVAKEVLNLSRTIEELWNN